MSSQHVLSRRGLLHGAIRWSAAGSLMALSACSRNAELVCADPGKLTPNEISLRTALNYTEEAPDAHNTCSNCGFFSAAQPVGCGQCQMLKGIVNANGHCSSWSAKS